MDYELFSSKSKDWLKFGSINFTSPQMMRQSSIQLQQQAQSSQTSRSFDQKRLFFDQVVSAEISALERSDPFSFRA